MKDRAKLEKLYDGRWSLQLEKGQALSMLHRDFEMLKVLLRRENVDPLSVLEAVKGRATTVKPIAIVVVDEDLARVLDFVMRSDITVYTDNTNMCKIDKNRP